MIPHLRAAMLGLAGLVSACGSSADEPGTAAHDPCTLLSAAEAEAYVGPLASPPYRSSDGAADARGDECMYRGSDGRELAVRAGWTGGESTGRLIGGIPGGLGGATGAPGVDSMAHRVMQETPGHWDHATWIPGGTLFASKGSTEVTVDVSGASGEKRDAIAIATTIMPRFDHPLRYDGARAVAQVPRARPHPARACDLIPRPAVEAAIGPLAGEPESESPETSCTWRVTTRQGERRYPVEFVWEGGRKNYQMLEHGMATVTGVMGLPTSSPLDTMKPPPGMQAAIGGIMKMLGSSRANGGASTAPGAAATIGFRTDTMLRGPWDKAALLHGMQLIGVRHGVFVGMGLQSADYDRARALLAAICSRL